MPGDRSGRTRPHKHPLALKRRPPRHPKSTSLETIMQATVQPDDILLTVGEVADIMQVDIRTLQRWRASKNHPAFCPLWRLGALYAPRCGSRHRRRARRGGDMSAGLLTSAEVALRARPRRRNPTALAQCRNLPALHLDIGRHSLPLVRHSGLSQGYCSMTAPPLWISSSRRARA